MIPIIQNTKIDMGIVKSGESLICVLMIDKLLTREEIINNSYKYCEQIIKYLDEKMNKVAIIFPSSNKELDCECLFLQYIPELNIFDTNGNCGNAVVASAVYYMNRKYLGNIKSLMIENINTNKRIELSIKKTIGDVFDVEVTLFDPEGTITPKPLPTGNIIDKIYVNNKEYGTSIVDAGNPYIFIERSQLELSMSEFKDPNLPIYEEFKLLRQKAKHLIGLNKESVFPKFAIVNSMELDNSIEARMITVPTWHKTFAITGLACLIKAALIPGTVVNRNIKMKNNEEVSVYCPNNRKMKVRYRSIHQKISTISLSQTVRLKGELK